MRGRIAVIVSLAVGSGAFGQATSTERASGKPAAFSPDRVEAIHRSAQLQGWAAQSPALRAAAKEAYGRGDWDAASAWFNAYLWSGMFADTEQRFVTRWMTAVREAGVGHAAMPTRYPMRAFQLGLMVTPECQAWLFGDAALSQEFFALVEPVDYLPKVLRILDDLLRHEPADVRAYGSLALAIALVYDVPPPPDWPHRQVSAETLPRQLPDPLDAFRWWVAEDRAGRTYHSLASLGAEELKFVVDSAAPLAELAWSQQVANYPLSQLGSTYTMIAYRRDRAVNQAGMWSEKSYTLPTILGMGGICVDQAYFATAAGKARGVPTLFFEGAGREARHAWFGYLDGDRKWQLDVGRYASQRFVTGFARDPQTWRVISDHALKFLAERFRGTASFRRSRIHTGFAADFLVTGDAAAAERAARKAIGEERRNPTAWDLLLAAEAALGREPRAREDTVRAAMGALQAYPDLEAHYSRRLSESLRARGETAAAEQEQQRIAAKFRGSRADLSVREAREWLLGSIATQPLREQVQTYNRTVDKYGRGAGVTFFDQIVVGFVEHLMVMREPKAALEAMERARQVMKVEPGTQLDQDFARLLRELKSRR